MRQLAIGAVRQLVIEAVCQLVYQNAVVCDQPDHNSKPNCNKVADHKNAYVCISGRHVLIILRRILPSYCFEISCGFISINISNQ